MALSLAWGAMTVAPFAAALVKKGCSSHIPQVNYALGYISGTSWVAGYGNDPPTYLWHKFSAAPAIECAPLPLQ